MPLFHSMGAFASGLFRRGSRFGMRTLLIIMSLCCVAMGAWTIYVQPFRAQAASLAKVGDLGGSTSGVAASGPVWHRWLIEAMVGKEQFVHVERADLRNCRVSAADVPLLAGLKFLKTLHLDRAEVTDENIAALTRMTNLRELSLTYTRISDEGLAQIARLPNLRTLHLTGVPISDASLKPLAAAAELRELYVRWTRITADGANKLQKALPNCMVHHHEIQQAPAADSDADTSS